MNFSDETNDARAPQRRRYFFPGARIGIKAAVVLAVAVGAALFIARTPLADVHAQVAAVPKIDVDVATVWSRPIVDWQTYSGRLQAVESIDIRPQVAGRLMAVHFHDGAMVKRGDVLFTIDPRPYASDVAKAKAQLASSKARASYTAAEMARAERLIAENAIAKSEYEVRQNAAREAAAGMQAAEAQLDAARLNLEYTQITAPISGRMSRAELTVGNVVEPGLGSRPLTSLVSTATLYAAIDVDERGYLKYVNAAQVGGSSLPVQLGLANETGYPRSGKLSSLDNRMDATSGTIRLRAIFDNADGKLVPGLYARVRFGGTARNAILIDDKAVNTDQDKRFVFVVDAQGKVSYREVTLGAMADRLRVVESGLKANERVIVTGSQLVKAGDVVQVREVAPDGKPLSAVPAQSVAAAGDRGVQQ